jgi:tungstate transport system ATP-binding protein
MAEAVLVLREISVQRGLTTTLRIPSLEVHAGEVIVIVGPNGAGKTTLLRVMGLLQRPATGTVFFHGDAATPNKTLALRRRMASVFQEPLLLNESVYYNASLGLRLRGLNREQIEKQLRPWLERLGIAHLTLRQARTLSGGEAQRTSLARALALSPELLLLDEPFSALDAPTREGLLFDLRDILNETEVTTVIVTHDLHEARLLGRRIGVLCGGRLLQLDLNSTVFTRPVSEEVAAIVGVKNRIPAVVEADANGMVTVCFPGGAARVAGDDVEPGTRVLLCLRPEDISLGRLDEPDGLKPMNRLRARVERMSPWMGQYRIDLRSSNQPLVALINGATLSRLCLREGEEVLASFDSAAAHLIKSSDH